MLYRRLGNTALNASILGLGTMRLPVSSSPHPDYTSAISIIRYAIENGINFFDVGTFYCHNHCEEAFGLATKNFSLDKIIISGKNSTHQSRDAEWSIQLRNSLSLFHRQFFDIYFIHYLNLDQWHSHFLKNKIIDQIKEAKDQGLYNHLGFSSHDKPENVRQLIETGIFEAVILPYNLLKQEFAETMSYAFHQGLGVIAMNPLAGGALVNSNLYLDDFQGQLDREKMSELSLNFVLSQPFIHCAFSGMESTTIINENIRTVHKERLSSSEINWLNQCISREKIKAFVPCTGCGYCLPRTQGIDIPAVIRIWNQFSILKGDKMFIRDYAALSVTAECCIRCDVCVSKCPHHIPIHDLMEQAAKLFYAI